MIPMIVLGLTLDGTTNTPILVLQQKYALVHEGKELEKRILPIWVGASEAMSISLALNGIQPERPLPHDLMGNMLSTLDVRLTSVSLNDLRDGTFYASLELLQNERLYHVDCRPSDGVTLALRMGLDIQVAESVLEKSIETRVHPHSTEAERRPSDNTEKLIEKAGRAGPAPVADVPDEAPSPESAPAQAPHAAPNLSESESAVDEQHFAELLRNLEPVTKRTM